MRNKNKYFLFIIVLSIGIFLLSCGKDENSKIYSLIPNVPVNFYIQPNTIDYIPAGSGVSFDAEGYRGVYIYRLDQYSFLAYEKTCPYDPEHDSSFVHFDPTTFTLIDSVCMSRYNIIDGMPVDGPSTIPLLQYMTEFDGNYLHIFNNR